MATPQTTQLRDSGRRRWADAARHYRVALERFAPFQRLHSYTLPLHLPAGTRLHSELASRDARTVVETIFGSITPAYRALEQGFCGGLHIHVTSPLPPIAVAEYAHVKTVYDLRGDLKYKQKPGYAALCKPDFSKWMPDSDTRRRLRLQALDEQAEARRDRLARGKSRLPPLRGWTGTRTKRPQVNIPHALSLAVRFHVLALAFLLAVSTPTRRAPSQFPTPARREAPRPAQRRPRPRAPDRPTSGLRV